MRLPVRVLTSVVAVLLAGGAVLLAHPLAPASATAHALSVGSPAVTHGPAGASVSAPTGTAGPSPRVALAAARATVRATAATAATAAAASATTAAAAAAARPAGKVVYLTFDDGPSPDWTPQIMQVLAAHHAHATFFELGMETELHPGLRGRLLAAGHAVGNHTYDHKSLPELTVARQRSEIARGPAASCLRPPFGDVDAAVRATAAAMHQRIVLWDVDTRDWSRPGTAAITRSLLAGAHDGAVVLMHDGGGDRSQTVAALGPALTALAARGYRFAALPYC